MSKAIRWQVFFKEAKPESENPKQYRVDIYDEQDSSWSGITELQAGDTPFVTDEDNSDNFFAPIRTQTGTLQICTLLPNTTDQYITLDELLPANNIARPVRLINRDNSDAIEWQGFLSCEAYSQDYTGIPQILDLPVISVLEATKSMELSYQGQTIGDFISAILLQIKDDTSVEVNAQYSQASDDILTKYLFDTQFRSYERDESTGNVTYITSAKSIYDVFADICQFMGWCLREFHETFYFTRIGADELGVTVANMSTFLSWMGTGHQRTLMQGAKAVSVKSDVKAFDTYFEMPICPTTGLSQKNAYPDIISMPVWYYDKCTQTNVGQFTSHDILKAFLARFYGIFQDSVFPWNTIYMDIGFNNCIYLVGQKYEDSSYSKICTIKSILPFSVICGVYLTTEDVGHLTLRIEDKVGADGYIRCGIKFMNKYYSGDPGLLWTNNLTSFKAVMSNGKVDINIAMPRINNAYTMVSSLIELYLFDDFDNGKTSSLISNISITYEPPFKKNTDEANSNKYTQKLSGFRDEVNVNLNLASSFNNRNALSLIYGIKTYTYSGESIDYLEPITTLTYNLAGGTTATRRPEVDLLNRLAAYYGAKRQTLELEVAHPQLYGEDAPLPLLKLNGINDGKVYLPLSESRDWQTGVCKLTCFETPT